MKFTMSPIIAFVCLCGFSTQIVSANDKFGGLSYTGNNNYPAVRRQTVTEVIPQGGQQGAQGPNPPPSIRATTTLRPATAGGSGRGSDILRKADERISQSEAQRRIDSQFNQRECGDYFCASDNAKSARNSRKLYQQYWYNNQPTFGYPSQQYWWGK